MPHLFIGCSGFSYKHWKGVFYPKDLSERKWLSYYSSIFSTVELNVTFYHLPSKSAFENWHRETPDNFIFAVKGSRYITHIKRLLDSGDALERFFEGAAGLKHKMSIVLWQFPPAFQLNIVRFSTFLRLLEKYPVRHTFEFRNASWTVPAVAALCKEHNAGLCMADSPEYINDLPVTADFVYIRRHGHGARYAGRYSKEQLSGDADRIRAYLDRGKDVYIYFNNDAHGYATMNARELADMFPRSLAA